MTLLPVCSAIVRCKCCGANATLYGLVDFSCCCQIGLPATGELSGIPIYYHRCPACGFLFTEAFDHCATEDLAAQVYNADYTRVDPEYEVIRPRANAQSFTKLFGASKEIAILDYGGGSGVFTAELRSHGFTNVSAYDPFVPQFATLPTESFDCVTCFETLEHALNPQEVVSNLSHLTRTPGLVILSTVVQPVNIDELHMDWWYVGPRNGHVSLYSRTALTSLFERHGLHLASSGDCYHFAYRALPSWARHLNLPSGSSDSHNACGQDVQTSVPQKSAFPSDTPPTPSRRNVPLRRRRTT